MREELSIGLELPPRAGAASHAPGALERLVGQEGAHSAGCKVARLARAVPSLPIAAPVSAVSSAYGFSVVFEGLQVVAYSVGGTIVLKNAAYRSPLAIGFLIGLSFMLTLDMLVVAVLAGANLAAFPLPTAPAPAEGAVVAFSVMLFIVYVSWAVMARACCIPVAGAGGPHSARPPAGLGNSSSLPQAVLVPPALPDPVGGTWCARNAALPS